MPTVKGEETRRRIVWAAWDLSGRRGIEQLLCGVSLREVAAEAGMSPSALTYHFPTMRDLALGMVEELVDVFIPDSGEVVATSLAGKAAMFNAIREAAAGRWALMTTPQEVLFEQRLSRCYSATDSAADGIAVMGHLSRFNSSWVEFMAAIYEDLATTSGLTLVEPFTFRDVAQVMAMLSEGLVHHWMCDNDSLREDLFADMAVVITGALTVPLDRTVGLEEIGPRARVGSEGEGDGPEMSAAEAGRVADLFTDGLMQVTITELAATMRCAVGHLLERFGSVRRVAALSFARHVPAVASAAARREDATAEVRLGDAAFELARCVQADPWCALALSMERIESRTAALLGHPAPDMVVAVPFDALFEDLFDGLIDEVGCADRLSSAEAAELLVDSALSYGASHPGVALSRVVEVCLR